MDSAEIIVRPAETHDKDFVMASWLKGQLYGSEYWSHMEPERYYHWYGNFVKNSLMNPMCKVDVAVLKDEPSLIIGYLVYKHSHIAWAYCKKDFRGKGITNLLMKDKQFLTYSADTRAGHAIAKRKQLQFNPFE